MRALTRKQREIHDAIRAEPGIPLRALAERHGVTYQAIRYRADAAARKLERGLSEGVQRATCERGHSFATFGAQPICPECRFAE